MLPVEKIQQWMKANSIDFFLINRTDEFLSEYIAPYAERLNWISKLENKNINSIYYLLAAASKHTSMRRVVPNHLCQ